MTLFRLLLIVLLISVVAYTVPVVANHGLDIFPIFFGDIARMEWPGQFNVDFMGFLILSAIWTAWRNQFSPAGLGLALIAAIGGIPFLTTYLLILSFQPGADIRQILLGARRAG